MGSSVGKPCAEKLLIANGGSMIRVGNVLSLGLT